MSTSAPQGRALEAHHRAAALPAGLLVVVFGAVSGTWELASAIVLLLLFSFVPAFRVAAGPAAQLLTWLSGIVAAFLLTARFGPEGNQAPSPLPALWFFVGLTGILLIIPRLFLRRPIGGPQVTAAMGLVTLMACGGFTGRRWIAPAGYALLCAIWMLLSLYRLKTAQQVSRPTRTEPGRVWRLALVLALSAAITVPLIVTLPVLHRMTVAALGLQSQPRSGFGKLVELGSLRGLLLSDRIVLRIAGDPTDYLRGEVYSRYDDGRWVARARVTRTVDDAAGAPPEDQGPGTLVRSTGGRTPHYFVPLDAIAVRAPDGPLVVDADGIFSAPHGPARSVRFWTGERDLAPPGELDLQVPADIRFTLYGLAREWTVGAIDPAARARAIATTLRDHYEYSLDFEADSHVDPVIDFLLSRRQGHCEYFASAMTLLARSIGIPARLVGGYRVTEHNPLTGEYIVRERNAHAWTEIWDGRRWVTIEATAPGDLPMATRTPWISAVVDAIGVWLHGVADWIAARRWWEVALTLGALLLAWWWLRRRRRAEQGRRVAGSYSDPPAVWADLSAALAALGYERQAAETIERFASRLETEAPELSTLPGLLRRYSRWRYSAHDDRALSGEMTRAVEQLRTRRDSRA